jgi:hypothetical protein
VLTLLANAEYLRVLPDLLQQIAVVTDDDHAVTPSGEFPALLAISGSLRRLIMDRAVAEDAHVGLIEEIGDAAHLWDFFLCVVGETPAVHIQQVEEASFQLRTSVGQRAQPRQGRVASGEW